MIFRKHSLLKRVTLWCAGTLAVFSLITAAASFAIGYEEAKDRQDDILKEVVGMLSRDIVQQRQRNKIQELTLGGFYNIYMKMSLWFEHTYIHSHYSHTSTKQFFI